MSFFITGGGGFIGSHIVRQIIETGLSKKVVVFDHFGRHVESMRREFVDYNKQRFDGIRDKITFERGEANHFGVLFQCLERHRPDYIIHLAALPLAKIPNLNTEEARAGAIDSTGNIFDILGHLRKTQDYKPKRFVYASSSMVYGDFITEKADETHPTSPKEIYGVMKLGGEILTRGLSSFYNISHSIVRPSAVYGPTDMNLRVSQIFLERAMLGQKIKVQGADETLDFTYVKDLAAGFILAATQPGAHNETFNITRGAGRSLLDYANILKKFFPDFEIEVVERDAFRPKRGSLTIQKAQKLLNFQPKYELETGISEYLRFVLEHNDYLRTVAEGRMQNSPE